MAHYAILNDQLIVEQVIVGKNEGETLEGESQTDWELFYSELFGKTVKRTSVNTHHNTHAQGGAPFRLNYAGPGMSYDPALDGFIYQKPFESWLFDATIGDYVAPVAMPVDGKFYQWDEPSLTWIAIDDDQPRNP